MANELENELQEEEKKNKTAVFYNSWRNGVFSELTYEEIGMITMALLAYADGDSNIPEQVNNDRALRAVYKMLSELVQVSMDKYSDTCKKNKANIEKRWAKEKEKQGQGQGQGQTEVQVEYIELADGTKVVKPKKIY